MISAWAIPDIPLIKEGDDLGTMIAPHVKDEDIVVVASTVVSKSEGCVVRFSDVKPSILAHRLADPLEKDPRLVQIILDESREVLVDFPFLLVETHNGHVCINAGVDQSNIDGDRVLVLPPDPDGSARRIRERIREISGKQVGLIVSDTNGRAFKSGQTGVALGISGIHAILDWRGKPDLFGRTLDITQEAVADEIACLANLLMGEADGGTPIVVVRGLNLKGKGSVKDLYRPIENDVIRRALRETKSKQA